MLFAGVLGGLASAIGGSLVSAYSANRQMKFQERMSNTSYARAMADMKSAGLNPMLAYQQGGATTPGGSSFQGPDIMKSISSATMAKRTGKLMDAEKANIEATTAKTVVDVDRSAAETNYTNQKAKAQELEVEINQLKLDALRAGVGAASSAYDAFKSGSEKPPSVFSDEYRRQTQERWKKRRQERKPKRRYPKPRRKPRVSSDFELGG